MDSQIAFGNRYGIKMGGSFLPTSQREDMYHQILKAYLNNFQTELTWDVPKLYDYKDGKITYKFSGKKFDHDGHVDQIYDSILRQESFDIDFVTELLPTYIPKSITLDAQTKNDRHFKSSIQYKELMVRGGYFFKNQQKHKVIFLQKF